MIGKNTNTQEKKRMKKYFSFILHNYCFFSISMIEKLIDFNDINFNILHYLLINFISNIFILSITSNISLDKIKSIIEEGCIIVFDYLTISREEYLDTNTYKIKYNDAIHFAYQKILSKINTIVKYNGQTPNNLKPMTANKNLGLLIEGINLIKAVFCCLFKTMFLNAYNQHSFSIMDEAINKKRDGWNEKPIDNRKQSNLVFNFSMNGINLPYYQEKIHIILHNHELYNQKNSSELLTLIKQDAKYCKKVDKIHNELNSIVFHNIDIVESFIEKLIPDILTCIKAHNFSASAYNMYIGHLTEYVTNTVHNGLQTVNIIVFIVIMLLVKNNNISDNTPHITVVNKYITHVKNKLSTNSVEQLFNCPAHKLSIDYLLNCNFLSELGN